MPVAGQKNCKRNFLWRGLINKKSYLVNRENNLSRVAAQEILLGLSGG